MKAPHVSSASSKTVIAQVFDPEFRKPFPSVERYWTTLARQPQFSAVIGSDWKLPTEAPTRECTWPFDPCMQCSSCHCK